MRAREKEEGKKKKVRGSYKKKVALNAATAGEAIEKMLAEKKISSKINYDILKSLDQPGAHVAKPISTTPARTTSVIVQKPMTPLEIVPASPVPRKRKKKAAPARIPVPTPSAALPRSPMPVPSITQKPSTPSITQEQIENIDDYDEDFEAETTEVDREISLAAMLRNGDDDDYYGYDEY